MPHVGTAFLLINHHQISIEQCRLQQGKSIYSIHSISVPKLVCCSSSFILRSALLSTFPWLTDFLVKKDDSLEEDITSSVCHFSAYKYFLLFDPHILKSMIRIFNAFEESLETTTGPVADDCRKLLAIAETDARHMPKMITLSRTTLNRACQLLTSYRVVDILHALKGRAILTGSNPRYSKLRLALSGDSRVSY